MPNGEILAAIVGLIAAGCGRIGFEAVSGGGDTGSDGGVAAGDGTGVGPPCIASSVQVTATAQASVFPAVAWNGSKAGITWFEDLAGTDTSHFRTVSPGGTVDLVVDLGAPNRLDDVDMAWDGASWQLAWSASSQASGPDLEIFRSMDGGPAQAITANGRTDLEVRLAPLSGGTVAYLWETDVGQGYDLVLSVVDAAGTKLVDNLTIVPGVGIDHTHDLVWTGSELVVFYVSASQLMMLRMTSNGSTIAGSIPIVSGFVSSNFSARWTGDRFLLSWPVGFGVNLVYVARDGTLLSPIVSSPMSTALSFRFSSAVGPTSDLVAWEADGPMLTYLLPVARDGTLGTLVTLPNLVMPSVAWGGTSWLIAGARGSDIYLLQLCP